MTFTEIITEARRLTKSKEAGYPTDEIVSSANNALEYATALIRQAEGRWQWDDSNYTDLPNATRTITSGQQDYSLDATHYRIERVEIKDTTGNWIKLVPFDQRDIDTSLTDFLDGSGVPQYYDKVGNSLMLYPAPDYTQAASLKVFYQRGPSYFTSTDTTKAPGFNPLFHRIIPLRCAYDWFLINQPEKADRFKLEAIDLEEQLQDFYSLRDKDEHVGLRTKKFNFN